VTARRLTLVAEPAPRSHRCDVFPLWTASRGYISTCTEHYGTPLHMHPSLAVVAK